MPIKKLYFFVQDSLNRTGPTLTIFFKEIEVFGPILQGVYSLFLCIIPFICLDDEGNVFLKCGRILKSGDMFHAFYYCRIFVILMYPLIIKIGDICTKLFDANSPFN